MRNMPIVHWMNLIGLRDKQSTVAYRDNDLVCSVWITVPLNIAIYLPHQRQQNIFLLHRYAFGNSGYFRFPSKA